uniref:Small ribosomal subunit protein bS16c n=1 Tax=Alsidium seaforthii TaxID=2007182 RepID=A0A1Z1MDT8_9FLOR|nr:ribosomal protein S16 [Bryothamnion seaforthii]ARW64042.1 ribosomal protein S16 [Bryothamnion seaforthii]
MLKIRLKKLGRKKKACYRIIVIDSRKKRDGKAIKEIGFYNPLNKQHQIDIIEANKKIGEGAKTTKTVKNLIKNK